MITAEQSICAPSWNNAASAFTRRCIRPPLMLLFRNCLRAVDAASGASIKEHSALRDVP